MDIKDIHNYKFTKNTHVRTTDGSVSKVYQVDFIDENKPIATLGCWVLSSEIEELFEKTKPTIAELPYGTKFKRPDGREYMSIKGANLKSENYNVFAVGINGNEKLFLNDIVADTTNYELTD